MTLSFKSRRKAADVNSRGLPFPPQQRPYLNPPGFVWRSRRTSAGPTPRHTFDFSFGQRTRQALG
ncbi:hypothetical protein [uncultured Sulfitobacter sp.]|uniref:hypothetical protein n=1 Tax=uncultured Sulfitobacter sp. TaxID=191468 RepID=UPI0030D7D4EE